MDKKQKMDHRFSQFHIERSHTVSWEGFVEHGEELRLGDGCDAIKGDRAPASANELDRRQAGNRLPNQRRRLKADGRFWGLRFFDQSLGVPDERPLDRIFAENARTSLKTQ